MEVRKWRGVGPVEKRGKQNIAAGLSLSMVSATEFHK
jgi:hypothetical protein